MSWREYLTPQVVKTFTSRYNRQIKLVRYSGSWRLDMGGLTQSGQIIEQIWATAFNKLLPRNFQPQKVLILGLGAGSAARLVSHRWPKVIITGVEIDPVVIEIGKEYFDLEAIPNLTILNADAVQFLRGQTPKPPPPAILGDRPLSRYDLVLVDCYLGDQFIPIIPSPRRGGVILINRLFWGVYQKPTLEFAEELKKHHKIRTCRTASNFLIRLG